MKHLGDITMISGSCVPPVDVVIGGSPCQDLSVAGKREGLAGARSGLFMEQIRLIKEMRNADIQRGRTDQFIRPRFMVWENVPGAFSSNKGDDFWAVLEETIRIAEPDAPDIPLPPKGKWPLADAWYGDGWSVAYRVLDAQFWGVPQRRRRIALVADFGGWAAPEILFVRKGVCRDTAESSQKEKRTSTGVEGGFGNAIALRERAGCAEGGKGPLIQVEKSGTLGCSNDQAIYCLQGNAVDRDAQMNGFGIAKEPMFTLNATDRHALLQPKANPLFCLNDQGGQRIEVSVEVAGTLRAQEHGHQPVVAVAQNQLGEVRTGTVAGTLNTNANASGRNAPLVFDARGNGNGETVCTITGDHENRVTDYTALVMATGQAGAEIMEDTAPTLNCNHEQPIVAKPITANHNSLREDMTTYPVFDGFLRRLTPLECERLQGYPDGWTDIGEWRDTTGKLHKESRDAARYKALGNSIALPPWAWVLKRLCGCYERPATMASLFDGIGGFPLIWERLNGPGSCLWASEIEEFPMAVTRRHFGEKGKERWT